MKALICLALLIGTTLTAGAHVASQDDSVALPPGMRAERLPEGAGITIDGVLDEEVWQHAQPAGGFTQLRPNPGQPASQRTEAFVLYDDSAIYVGIRAYDDEPDRIVRRLARRGQFVVSDKLFVGFDSYGDGRTAFLFGVNAAGVKYDVLVYNDVWEDDSWEAVWDVAVAEIPEGGWSAEFRIPLSQLRFPADGSRYDWGVQFMREIARDEEQNFWAPLLPESSGMVSLFGRLDGIEGLRPPRRLELQPYVASSLTRAPGDPASPFYSENAFSGNAGLDLKVGLTSSLTLTATVNPDFGQVEADPAVVNLSAFETFFEERRPFFLEGIEVFQFGRTRSQTAVYRPTFFYSRRIGRAPQRGVGGSNVVFAEVPSQSTIAAAGKVSGRVGDWSIGGLNATTLEGTARYIDPEGIEHRLPVEPLTNYSVGRIRRDLRGGATVLGAMVTATQRHLSDPTLESLMAERAYVAGVDFEHAWDRTWAISGVLAGSYVGGSADFASRLQRMPQRYFQRPDATHLEIDDTRTSLTGGSFELAMARISGKIRGSVTLNAVTPGFDTNDLGFQNRADGYGVSGIVTFQENDPGVPWLRSVFANVNSGMAFNGAGDLLHRAVSGNASAQHASYWRAGVWGSVTPLPIMSDRLTRGGPLAERPGEFAIEPWIASDDRQRVTGRLWVNLRRELGDDEGSARMGGMNINIRPAENLDFQLSPMLGHEVNPDQYVAARTDAAAEATFGRRYVFARLEQRTASLGLRANLTFTPTLSLQVFTRPFIAAGQFSRFKEFAAPGTREFDVYGVDRGDITREDGRYVIDPGDGGETYAIGDPNFTFRSLRGNAVLRWEYRPGSTLFLVWQQERTGFDPTGQFDLGGDLTQTLREPVHNVFLLKLTYWFGG